MYVKKDARQLMKAKRKELGMTGAELGRRMGITTQHYWNLENGHNRLTLEYAFAASEALGVNIDFFCEKVKRYV